MAAGKDGFIILIQINRIIYDDFIIKLHESKLRVKLHFTCCYVDQGWTARELRVNCFY